MKIQQLVIIKTSALNRSAYCMSHNVPLGRKIGLTESQIKAAQGSDYLRSPDLEFEPLLPADDLPLTVRVAALAAWCGGFLYGFGAGALKPEALRDKDLAEYLRDVTDIARAELEPDRDAEAGEGDFFELVEFVRAGAQLAFDGLAEARCHAA